MAEPMGRAVLEIASETGQYFADLAKVKGGALDLSVTFAKASASITKGMVETGQSMDLLARRVANVATMAGEFSGAKIARDADEIAAAVGRVGGASKLTASEQQRVNQVVTEAIAKYKQLGQEAPAHLTALAKATQAIPPETEKVVRGFAGVGASLQNMAAMFGLAFGAGAISAGAKQLISHAIDAASAVDDASKRLKVSAEAYQGWVAAARLAGGTAEDVSNAIEKMNENLDGGNASTVEALKKAGLEFSAIRAMSPEQAFGAIATAIMKIPDPMTQARVSVELLGKSAKTLLPAIKDDIVSVGAAADKMSDATIAAMDAAGDALTRLEDRITKRTASSLGELALTLEEMGKGTEGLKRIAAALAESKGQQDAYIAALVRMRTELAALSPQEEAEISRMLKQGSTAKEIAASFREVVRPTVLAYAESLTKLATVSHLSADEEKKRDAAARKSAEAVKAYAAEVQKLADTYTGLALAAEIKKVTDGIAAAGGVSKISGFQLQELARQAQQFRDQGGQLSPVLEGVRANFLRFADAGIKIETGLRSLVKLFPSVALAAEQMSAEMAQSLQDTAFGALLAKSAAAGLPSLGIAGTKNTKVDLSGLKETKAAADGASSAVQDLANELVQLAQVSGSSWGAVAKGIGTSVVAINGLGKAMSHLDDDGVGFSAKNLAALSAGWVGVGVAVAQASAALASHFQKAHQISNAIKDVAKEIGVGISNGLATGIAAEAEALKKLDSQLTSATARHYAELLNLDKIIAATGGLNSTNLVKWTGQAERLFEVVKRGGELGAKAAAELVTIIGLFAKQADATGGVWSETFKKLLADTKALGVGVAEINALMAGQQSKLVAGAVGVTAAIGKQATSYLELKKAVEDATKEGDADKIAAAQNRLTAAVVTTQDEFDRLSRIELGAFNTLVASGVDSVTAMGQVGAGIDDLIRNADAFGLSGNAAFETLSRWRDLTTANAPLLTQIGNLNDLMVASANLGSLTADGFADIEAQGRSAYEQLTKAGLTQQEAETAMKPLLESIIQLHKDKGFAIDDETQKLIEQARKDGVITDEKLDTNDILMEGFSAIIKAVGGDIPDAFKKFSKAGKDAAADVTDALSKIPTDFDFTVGVSRAGDDTAGPGFAQGTKGQYLNFGAGTRTILHGWERVMTAPEGVAEARIDRQPSGPLTITVVSQLDGREVARNQVRYTADAWRERGF